MVWGLIETVRHSLKYRGGLRSLFQHMYSVSQSGRELWKMFMQEQSTFQFWKTVLLMNQLKFVFHDYWDIIFHRLLPLSLER